MKTLQFFSLLFCFASTATVSAAAIDFRTTPYASTFGLNQTTDSVNGVNFTITATARGANGFRQNSDGLRFGVPGNGMYSISIVSDTDIEYTSLTGAGHTLTNRAGQLPFDIFVDNTLKIDNLQFGPNAFSTVNLNNIAVTAGQTFLIDVDFNALTGSSIFASAALQSLNFNTRPTVAAVPLPNSILLFVCGLALLGSLKNTRNKAI